MTAIRRYDPEKAVCDHDLVPPGRCCPACCWDFANSGDSTTRHHAIRQAYMKSLVVACQTIVPKSLRDELERQAMEGPWYALRFTVRWHETQQRSEQQHSSDLNG